MDPTQQSGSLNAQDVERLGEAAAAAQEAKIALLTALGQQLGAKRRSAIQARQRNGIDMLWQEDIEFYEGVDDANRGEQQSTDAWHTKLPGQTMPGIAGEVRSTVFLNITRTYCDAAASRVADMLIPSDDRAFNIKPRPVPDLIDLSKGILGDDDKQDAVRQAAIASDNPVPGPQDVIPQAQKKIAFARSQLELARQKAKAAERQIDTWLIECQYHAEVRRVIEDAARIGTGVLKGPVPMKRQQTQVVEGPNEQMGLANGELAIAKIVKIEPGSKRIDPLNLFPDPSCGHDIHNGSWLFERDYISSRKLMELRDMPGYIGSQIDLILAEGPAKMQSDAPPPQGDDDAQIAEPSDRYEIWYFTGMLGKADLMGLSLEDPAVKLPDHVHVMITMVNDRPIKGAINPLTTGDFPYDVINWQSRPGHWAGIGVSRQVRVPQRMINAACRNMMDNAGLAAGPQILVKLGVVTPMDGNYTLSPRKVWTIDPNADPMDLNQVFRAITIESDQQDLMAIINFALKEAEDTTSLPMLLQGQGGKAPETVGGMQLLTNNASSVLRRIARQFDDRITEPHIRRYYAYLMEYGDDEVKGDFQIDARGSSALVERDIQNQAVQTMASIVLNPAFGIDPKKWFGEWCKAQRLDPKSFQMDEQELEQLSQQPPPEPPALQAEQMRIQGSMQLAQFEAQQKERLQQMQQEFEARMQQNQRAMQQMVAEINNASNESLTLQDLKARLAAAAIHAHAEGERTNALAAIHSGTAGAPVPAVPIPPTQAGAVRTQ